MNIIDAHVHVWTSDLVAYPLAAGYSAQHIQPQSFTVEEFLTIARQLGVAKSVLIQADFYGVDNSYLLNAINNYPEVFSGVAQVDECSPVVVRQLHDLIARGVRGVRIVPPKPGDPRWLDTPGMHAMWARGRTDGLVICPLIDADDLPTVARMCQQHRETLVVIDHAANIGSDGQFREVDLKALTDLAQFPKTYVKVSGFYYLGKKRPPYDDCIPLIRRLFDAFGSERLMWGSDCPFQMQPPNKYQASIEFVRDRLDFLSSSDKEMLLHGTAASVFFPKQFCN